MDRPDIRTESSEHVTEKMLASLKAGYSITAFFEDNSSHFLPHSFSEIIKAVIQSRKMTSASIIRDSGINRRYYFDILSGKKQPSRNYVIRLLLVLKLSVQDAQWILKTSGYPQMYVRTKRDAVIIYSFEHSLSVAECNVMLHNVKMESI